MCGGGGEGVEEGGRSQWLQSLPLRTSLRHHQWEPAPQSARSLASAQPATTRRFIDVPAIS